jgi:uncharacterized protein YeaO (DUF488 family)
VALKLSTYAYKSPRRRGEGLRVGCARLPARGVKKSDYARQDIMDVWLPIVAPSRALLQWALRNQLDHPKTWRTYVRRYRGEMSKTEPRETIRFLSEVAQRTPIALGCYCHGEHCHRFVLEQLVREAARKRA